MDSPSVIIDRMMKLGKYKKQETLALTLDITPGTLSDYRNKNYIQNHLIDRFIKKHPNISEIELCYGQYQADMHLKTKDVILESILNKAIELELLHKESLQIYKRQSEVLEEILKFKKN